MRSAIALACFAMLSGCHNAQRTQPDVDPHEDYAEVSFFYINNTPPVHLYVEVKPAGKVRLTTYEKLSRAAADGSHLHISHGFRGYGVLLATFTGDDARRLLAACNSPEALAEARDYHLVGYNSNRWVVNRLKQAGLWTAELEDKLPMGAIQ
jgi:hypothetical protein